MPEKEVINELQAVSASGATPTNSLLISSPPVTKRYLYLTLDCRKGASYTVYEQVYEGA